MSKQLKHIPLISCSYAVPPQSTSFPPVPLANDSDDDGNNNNNNNNNDDDNNKNDSLVR